MKAAVVVGVVVILAVGGYFAFGGGGKPGPGVESSPRNTDITPPPPDPGAGSSTPDVPAPVAQPESLPMTPVEGMGADVGRVRVSARLVETPTARRDVPISAEMAVRCGRQGIPDESLLVATDGGIRYVMIELFPAAGGSASSAPTEPVVADQKGCLFMRHVSVIRAGTTVRFANTEGAEAHNVSIAARRPGNQGGLNQMVQPGADLSLVFASPERIAISCTVHPWMKSYVCVTDAAHFGLTGVDGAALLEGIPPGVYEVKVWHEPVDGFRFALVAAGTLEVRGGHETLLTVEMKAKE